MKSLLTHIACNWQKMCKEAKKKISIASKGSPAASAKGFFMLLYIQPCSVYSHTDTELDELMNYAK